MKNKNDKINNDKNEQVTNKSNIDKVHENKSDDSSQNMTNIKPSNVVKTKHFRKISRKDNETQNINCTINQSQHHNVNKNVSTLKINNNNQCITNDKCKKMKLTSSSSSSLNNKHNKRDLSPSQIYITVNDTFSNNLSSESSLKYKKTFNDTTKPIIDQQGIGFKQQTISNNFLYSKAIPLSSLEFQRANKLPSTKTTKYHYFNNEEEELSQKMKLHKKNRKRKFVPTISSLPNEFEMTNFDKKQQIAQPPKKRLRYGNKSRQRSKNKSRGNNKYSTGLIIKNHTTTNNNDHSTDCFDDEEDDGSDIDLNANNNNLRRPQSQHL